MPKRGYKRQPQPHQSPSLPTLTAAEMAAAEAVGPDVIPIVGTPEHVGMVPISQPGGTFAVWADPLVQGLGADGTPAADVNPVLISGKGPDGNQHAITVDPNGALDAKIRNEVDVHISDTVGQPVFSTNESLNVWLTGSDVFKFDGQGNLQVSIQNSSLTASIPNVDVALSTRTKPSDQQHAIIDSGTTVVTQPTGTNLHVVVDSAPTTAVTNAGLTNLDVALSTRTKPADQQHAIIDSGTVTAVTAITNALPAGSNVIGHVIADTGSTTAVTGNVTAVQPTGSNLHVVVDTAPTTAVTGTVAVSGTVPVSAASLPLPTNAAQETGGNLAAAVTQQTANIEFQQQLILLLEAIRRGVTALACEGGRNNPQDFDLAAIAQELTQPDMLLN